MMVRGTRRRGRQRARVEQLDAAQREVVGGARRDRVRMRRWIVALVTSVAALAFSAPAWADAGPYGSPVLDSFASDGGVLSTTNWVTPVHPDGSMTVSANALTGVDGGTWDEALWNTSYSNSSEVWATIAQGGSNDVVLDINEAGGSKTAGSTAGYFVDFGGGSSGGSPNSVSIFRVNGGEPHPPSFLANNPWNGTLNPGDRVAVTVSASGVVTAWYAAAGQPWGALVSATDTTYTGGRIGIEALPGVQYAFSEFGGGSVTPTSPAAVPPTGEGPPLIAGTPTDGQTLHLIAATFVGTDGNPPVTIDYQWKRCDVNGANCVAVGTDDSSYQLSSADVGARIEVSQTATNGGGTSAPQTSALTAQVAAIPVANSGAPALSNANQVGQTIAGNNGVWTGSTPISYAYQWQRCNSAGGACQPIAGATASSHLLSAADVGATLRLAVTASNAAGPAASPAVSAPSAVIKAAAGNPGPISQPAPGPVNNNTTISRGQILGTLAQDDATVANVLSGLGTNGLGAHGSASAILTLPQAGHLEVDLLRITYSGRGRHRHRHTLVLGSGQLTLTASGSGRLTITLTTRGRTLLRHSHVLTITIKATFTPSGGSPVPRSKTITLKFRRHPHG